MIDRLFTESAGEFSLRPVLFAYGVAASLFVLAAIIGNRRAKRED